MKLSLRQMLRILAARGGTVGHLARRAYYLDNLTPKEWEALHFPLQRVEREYAVKEASHAY